MTETVNMHQAKSTLSRLVERALAGVVGAAVARQFIRRNDPQCVTRTRSREDGTVERADSFIIADQGTAEFLDCAFHETLHAFGLGSHDDRNPWTTLNQKRSVGYLSVYDRAMLTLLYDPRIRPGMSRAQVSAILPGLIRDLCARRGGSDQGVLDCVAP